MSQAAARPAPAPWAEPSISATVATGISDKALNMRANSMASERLSSSVQSSSAVRM